MRRNNICLYLIRDNCRAQTVAESTLWFYQTIEDNQQYYLTPEHRKLHRVHPDNPTLSHLSIQSCYRSYYSESQTRLNGNHSNKYLQSEIGHSSIQVNTHQYKDVSTTKIQVNMIPSEILMNSNNRPK